MALLPSILGLLGGSTDASGQLGSFGTDNYHSLGRSCATGIIVLLTFMLSNVSAARRLLYACAMAILMVALVMSGLRQAVAGLVVAVIALPAALWLDPRGHLSLRRYTIGTALAAMLIVGLAITDLPRTDKRPAEERILQMVTIGKDAGWNPKEENRPGIMANALRLWTIYPVCGAGFGGYANFVSLETDNEIKWPHNLLLEILCELGIIGEVPALLLLATPFIVWLRECRRPQNYVAVALGCLWLFQFTCAMVSWDMNDNRMLFAIGAMIVANAGFRKSMDLQLLSDNIAVAPSFKQINLS